MWTPVVTTLVVLIVVTVTAFLIAGLIGVYFRHKTETFTLFAKSASKALENMALQVSQKSRTEHDA